MTRLLRSIRKTVIVVAVLTVLGLAALWAARLFTARPLCDGCNVILISIDTLGAKHTSVENPELSTTPFLKELADTRAIVFDHTYAQAPWALPSNASLLTGEYPWDTGISAPLDKLPPNVTTIAQALKKKGYETAGFSNGTYVQELTGLTQGIDHFEGSYARTDWNDLPGLTERAAAWMLGRKKTSAPFFLLIRPFAPHAPYGNTVSTHDIVAANVNPDGPSSADIARFMDAYHGEVHTTDDALHTFFNALDASPYAKDTIVIITSDNGEEFGEHGSVGVHDFGLNDEHIQVPLMIVLPNGIAKRFPETVELRSIPATILDLVGAGNAYHFSGPSLVPIIKGTDINNQVVLSRTSIRRDAFLANTEANDTQAEQWGVTIFPNVRGNVRGDTYARSGIHGRWHVIVSFDGSISVYDMQKDPSESENLQDKIDTLPEQEQLVVRRLIGILLMPQ
jgi:arylsulfatase A-like enzyme